MTVITDEAQARALLEAAIGTGSKPTLTTAQVTMLLEMATTLDDDDDEQWTSADLDRSATLGWNWKAGLTADRYDLGGGSGKYLKLSQWWEHCRGMAAAYATGAMSVVDGGTGTSGGARLGSVGVYSSTAWEEFA